MQYKRLMGVDYGDKRIGIAFSDLLQVIASPHEIYNTKTREEDLRYLSMLAKSWEVEKIIFGLPLNMDGTEGERAKLTREFALELAELSGIAVDFEDERLTSLEADDLLIEAGYNWKKRKTMIDKLSASLILENYMKKIRR